MFSGNGSFGHIDLPSRETIQRRGRAASLFTIDYGGNVPPKFTTLKGLELKLDVDRHGNSQPIRVGVHSTGSTASRLPRVGSSPCEKLEPLGSMREPDTGQRWIDHANESLSSGDKT